MHETSSASLQQEIQSNMSVAHHQGAPCNNQELESQHSSQHIWGNSRASRRHATQSGDNNNLNNPEQHKSPRECSNPPNSETILNISHNVDTKQATKKWLESVDRRVKSADTQNNRACSENLETLRENARNSQELIQRSNSVNIMDIEQSLRASRNSLLNTAKDSGCSMGNSVGSSSLSLGSSASLSRSTDELESGLRPVQPVDPHTAAIDLSNNCRQFYFTHMKNAESIKQSIRTTRHARARDKMEGRQPSRVDSAMHKLRTEMADLMDQDLSLMSQLLKLNDKIEDIKYQASLRGHQGSFDSGSSYFGSTDMSDSETSDYEDSRVELTKSVNSPGGYVSAVRRQSEQMDVQRRSVDSPEKDIVVYRKRSRRTRKAKKAKSSSGEDTATEDNDEESDQSDDEEEGFEDDDDEDVFSSDEDSKTEENSDVEHENKSDEDGESHSDTCSTISNNSDTSQNSDDSSKTRRKMSDDGGVQSPTPKSPEVPAKPVKGGVSRNTSFLDFHKNNGNGTAARTAAGFNPLLTYQGHNVSVEKYYVPQSLVYLKHTKDENVFCQFQH